MLAAFAREHGFTAAVYMQLGHGFAATGGAEHGPRFLAATPGFDVERYLRRGYLAQDPLAHRARVLYAPLVWRLSDLERSDADKGRFLAVMAGWGLRAGVLLPVQDYACGPSFICGFWAEEAAADVVRDLAALMWDAAQAHMAYRSLPALAGAEAALNAREMEVLRLAAVGRTEQETALALGLSRRGVQFHLGRAMEKLAAPNKTAAVALAVSAGSIRL